MTLLVGFPFDDDDDSGLALAATFARSAGTDLRVVTVVPSGWPTTLAEGTDREFEAWAVQAGQAAVDAAESLLRERFPDVVAQVVAVHGRSVPTTLVEQAKACEAAMVVIGSSHDGPYGHVNLASTTQSLLHASPVPVALATRGYSSPPNGRIDRATAAYRGDARSTASLEQTAAICHTLAMRLRIATLAVRGRGMYPPLVHDTEQELLGAWVEKARALQQSAVARLRDAGQLPEHTETVVATGRTLGACLDSLEWDRADVLVVGSSPASMMSRIFLGSNGSKIVRLSPVPVIVVP